MLYLSRRVNFICFSILSFFGLFLFFRLLFIASFYQGMVADFSDLIWALWVGIRFDLRLACMIILPIGFLFLIPILNPTHNQFLKKITRIYLLIIMISVTVFYISDLGNYSYLDQRIDVSSFKLLENPLIALDMIWETYPVLWIILGSILIILAFWQGIKYAFDFLYDSPKVIRYRHKTIGFIVSSTILLFSIWPYFSKESFRKTCRSFRITSSIHL